MNIGFMGRSKLLLDTIKLLKNNKKHNISFIWTSEEESFYDCTSDEFKNLAFKINCKFFYSPNEIELKKLPPTDLIISVNFINILSEKFLNRFKFGVINAHAGDLPRYKGNACPNWAIINKEKFVSLTIHQMNKSLDSGPIYMKSKFMLTKDTYFTDVYNWLLKETPNMFLKTIKLIESGYSAKLQQGKTLRVFPRKPEDSRLDLTKDVNWNYNLIRASSFPLPGAFCFFNEKKITILKARPIKLNYDFLAIDGQILEYDSNKKTFVFSIKQSALKVEKFFLNNLNQEDSFNIISSSLRNRLN